jgi:hypothetical protein
MARKIAVAQPHRLAGRLPGPRGDADFDPLLSAWGIPTRPPRPGKAPDRVVSEGIASPWAALMPAQPPDAAEPPDT